MNEYEKTCKFIYLIIVALIIMCLADGCAASPAGRDDSVVEGRILAARLDERNRIAQELSADLRENLRQIDNGVDAIAGAGQRVEYAIREYRQLTLYAIDRLYELANEVPTGVRVDVETDNNAGGVDRR